MKNEKVDRYFTTFCPVTVRVNRTKLTLITGLMLVKFNPRKMDRITPKEIRRKKMTTMSAAVQIRPNPIARHPLVSFFGIAILIGWLSIVPSLVWGLPFKPFQTLGAYGPLLAAVIVSAAEGAEALKALLRRMTNFRFGFGWYLFALLYYPVVYIAVAGLSGAPLIESVTENWRLMITAYLPAMFSIYLINAFGEEAGWTAFAQNRLQSKFRPALAATILGVLWAAWHIPAYFVPSEMGPFNPAIFAIFTVQLIFTRIIWTWAANHARGSGIAAMLLHASSNAVSLALLPQLFPPPTPDQLALSGLALLGVLLVTTVLLVIATRGRLGYRR
jgi:membrane protease YdiL (CAAX protease family)